MSNIQEKKLKLLYFRRFSTMNVSLPYLHLGSQYELVENENGSKTLQENDSYLRIVEKNFRDILQNLAQSLAEISAVALPVAAHEITKIQDFLKSETVFTPQAINPALYPHLWAKTSRYWATTITAPAQEKEQLNQGSAASKEENIAAYDQIEAFLIQLKASHPWYKRNKISNAIRKNIQEAESQLTAVRKEQKRRFLYQLKTHTAEAILQQLVALDKPQPIAPSEELRQEEIEEEPRLALLSEVKKPEESTVPLEIRVGLQRVRDLQSADESMEDNANHLKTREQVLEEHHRLVKLEKDLFTFIQGKDESGVLKEYLTQLSVVTRRWLDPHYKQPVYSTAWEKFRVFMRGATAGLGLIGAVGIIVSVLLFPPLIPIFTAISFCALYGCVDNIYEMAKNLVCYKRSPNRIQIRETAIFTLIVTALLGGIPGAIAGLGALLPALSARGGVIVHGVITGMRAFSQFGTNTIFTFLNLRGVILQGKVAHQEKHHIRSQSQITQHPVVPVEVGKEFICKTQAAHGVKHAPEMLTLTSPIMQVPLPEGNAEPQRLSSKKEKGALYYLYAGVPVDDEKGKQPLEVELEVENGPTVDNFFATKSQSAAIYSWHTSPWLRSSYTKEVVDAVAKYHNLGADTSIADRKEVLNGIARKIDGWENSHYRNKEQETRRWAKMMELKKYIENEQAVFSQLPRARENIYPVLVRINPPRMG
jgi:hypothetical protein